VQALKAGIMEIPDVIAVNKMDHPGAKTMLQEVRSIVALDPDRERRPPILLTEALRGEGVPELWDALERRRSELEERGELDAAARAEPERRGRGARRRAAPATSARGDARGRRGASADRGRPAARGRPADARRARSSAR
jgi:LAO/AO transport system kinase